MAIREFFDNLFGPIPQSEPFTGRQLTAVTRQAVAQNAKQVRDLDPGIWYPTLTEQAAAAFGMSANPYRIPTVAAALGTPAIFRAVSLIANTTGSLAVETYRNGVLMPFDQAPQIVKRPDPFRAPNVFYRDTAFWLAAYGEAWWWIARRDGDGLASSLIVVPPWEITVDDTDRLNPIITWTVKGKQTVMDPRDMRQITFLPNPAGGLRGIGPLQQCKAAASVAVESQDWAANFYAQGGYPSLVIKYAGVLGQNPDYPDAEHEADAFRNQFRDKPHNTPRVVDESVEDVSEFGVNPQGAQMLDARLANKGDAANMFGIPGALLEYASPGSSLTYQNVQEVFRMFVRTSLQIGYLEKIEQELTDLLPRTTSAHFNLDSFERSDPKARWETYNLMVPVVGQEEAARVARQAEGLEAGDIEFAPVPFSPPAAFPTSLPVARSAETTFRCTGKKLVNMVKRPCNRIIPAGVDWTCNRCGKTYEGVA